MGYFGKGVHPLGFPLRLLWVLKFDDCSFRRGFDWETHRGL